MIGDITSLELWLETYNHCSNTKNFRVFILVLWFDVPALDIIGLVAGLKHLLIPFYGDSTLFRSLKFIVPLLLRLLRRIPAASNLPLLDGLSE